MSVVQHAGEADVDPGPAVRTGPGIQPVVHPKASGSEEQSEDGGTQQLMQCRYVSLLLRRPSLSTGPALKLRHAALGLLLQVLLAVGAATRAAHAVTCERTTHVLLITRQHHSDAVLLSFHGQYLPRRGVEAQEGQLC